LRSKNVDKFNHDPWADDYDADVLNEADPIRAGYEALLSWIAEQVPAQAGYQVADLGAGTGNLTVRLPTTAQIVIVDTSVKMMEIARGKLVDHTVTWIDDDILSWLTGNVTPQDAFVSSYALHHLTSSEKMTALQAMARHLKPGGQITIGDLMFRNAGARDYTLKGYQTSGQTELVTDIEDEFFWDIDADCRVLEDAGLDVEVRQFSDLTWGFVARSA
jgi:putative AdoMet-dependent methyltransferase